VGDGPWAICTPGTRGCEWDRTPPTGARCTCRGRELKIQGRKQGSFTLFGTGEPRGPDPGMGNTGRPGAKKAISRGLSGFLGAPPGGRDGKSGGRSAFKKGGAGAGPLESGQSPGPGAWGNSRWGGSSGPKPTELLSRAGRCLIRGRKGIFFFFLVSKGPLRGSYQAGTTGFRGTGSGIVQLHFRTHTMAPWTPCGAGQGGRRGGRWGDREGAIN